MKLLRNSIFLLVCLCLFSTHLFSAQFEKGQARLKPLRREGTRVEGTQHQITGTVSKVKRLEGVITVKGRRKELSFRVGEEAAKNISTGERVRVYYVSTPEKKTVVRRIKKLNNGENAAGEKRGRKERVTGEF